MSAFFLRLGYQKCTTPPALINSCCNGYSQGLRYYLFAVKLYRCARGCNTPNDLPHRVCFANKTKFKSKRSQHD